MVEVSSDIGTCSSDVNISIDVSSIVDIVVEITVSVGVFVLSISLTIRVDDSTVVVSSSNDVCSGIDVGLYRDAEVVKMDTSVGVSVVVSIEI